MRALAALLLGLALAAAGPEPPLAERLQAAALAYAGAQAAGQEGTYTFKVLRPPQVGRMPAGRITLEPDHLSRQDLGGTFFVTLKVAVDGRPWGLARVDLEGRWQGTLLRARGALARRTVPGPEDLEPFPFEGVPPAGALREIPPGWRLRGPVAAGHVLVRGDLEPIPVVQAGDLVRLSVTDGPLRVTVEAVAKTKGAVGDRIGLEMPSSRKRLQGVVTGPGEARAAWSR